MAFCVCVRARDPARGLEAPQLPRPHISTEGPPIHSKSTLTQLLVRAYSAWKAHQMGARS